MMQCLYNKMVSFGYFIFLFFKVLLTKPHVKNFKYLLLKQIYMQGSLSLIIIMVSGFFIGMVLALQSYIVLIDFGIAERTSSIVGLSLLRELGPVVAGILFLGRAGSAMTAEVGLMKATEQLSSLEIMAVNPNHYILLPRLLAGIIVVPLLTFIFCTSGILGGYVIVVVNKSFDSLVFWSNLQSDVSFFPDILYCFIKSIVFSIVIVWLSLFNGYTAVTTAEGLSRATTYTVVNGALLIFGIDFLLTSIMFGKL